MKGVITLLALHVTFMAGFSSPTRRIFYYDDRLTPAKNGAA